MFTEQTRKYFLNLPYVSGLRRYSPEIYVNLAEIRIPYQPHGIEVLFYNDHELGEHDEVRKRLSNVQVLIGTKKPNNTDPALIFLDDVTEMVYRAIGKRYGVEADLKIPHIQSQLADPIAVYETIVDTERDADAVHGATIDFLSLYYGKNWGRLKERLTKADERLRQAVVEVIILPRGLEFILGNPE